MSIVISTRINQKGNKIIKNIPLGNFTVSCRIDEMAQNIEEQLIEEMEVKMFSLQIDEAILLVHVRFDKEEMVFVKKLTYDWKIIFRDSAKILK